MVSTSTGPVTPESKTKMKTYTETNSETATETEHAIARSISQDEIVRVECVDTDQLADWINANYDDVDSARQPDGSRDIWGNRSGEAFRLRLVRDDQAG